MLTSKMSKFVYSIKEQKAQKTARKRIKGLQKRHVQYGSNLTVLGDIDIIYSNKLTIGDNCRLNSHVYINARSGVTIGDDVTLSYGVKIISTGYDVDQWIKTGRKIHIENQPIFIGNHCWVGAGATILPGVNIMGEYVVIAADAVVTKDVTESKVVLAGNPAKIVKHLM